MGDFSRTLVGHFWQALKAEDLKELVFAESDARFVLTCRQAVYEGLRQQIPSGFREFFPLGFSQDDIRAYAVAHAIDPDAFDTELERTDLWIEVSIPFVVSELVKVFRTHRRLENWRGTISPLSPMSSWRNARVSGSRGNEVRCSCWDSQWNFTAATN